MTGQSRSRVPAIRLSAEDLLHRAEPLASLDRAVTRKVTIISAPPGSGKTSLLRTWVEHTRGRVRVVTVVVPRDQQDPQQFWRAVLDAVQEGSRGATTRTPAAPSFDCDAMVESIIAELAAQSVPVVLVIDDLHELHSLEALRQLERLLANLPGPTRSILSARRDPTIRLHRLRLADEVSEIRATDLRFSESETRDLLTASGIPISQAAAAALHQRTEGWAAGLRLAALSLSSHPDPERFIARFSGSDRAVSEYLIAEMLELQPDDVQALLLRTSIVDRVSGELADRISGRIGSERILLELEDANAFVVSLDSERVWFRYHQLLSDFLRLELRRKHSEEVTGLHRVAAAWFLERGSVVEAVRHTQSAGDWADAARILGEHVFSLRMNGHVGTIEALLRGFPAGMAADQPDLALAHAVAELLQGRRQEAAAHLTLAEAHLETVSEARRHRLEMAITAVRLSHARRTMNFAEVIERCTVTTTALPGSSPEQIELGTELRGVALMNLGCAEVWAGQMGAAERHLLEGATLAQTIGQPFLELTCRAQLGFPSMVHSFALARERCQQAIALAEQHGWSEHPVIAPACATFGGTSILMGDFEEGERWLDRARNAALGDDEPAIALLLHTASGMLYAGRREDDRALEELEAAERIQEQLTGEHALAAIVSGWIAATQARLGMLDAARASLEEISSERARSAEIANARATIHLAEGDPETALSVVRGGLETARSAIRSYTIVEAELLAAQAHLKMEDRPGAVVAVEAALARAESDRVLLPFAVTGALQVLDLLPRHETSHGALLVDLLDLVHGRLPTRPTDERLVDAAALTRSELRVLRFLSTNLTRADIASELCVSVNTVNTHLRRIYLKLDVPDRSAAVERARELRLLSTSR